MKIEKRSMNWLPRPSLYDEAETARLKRQINARDAIKRQTNNAAAFSSLNTSSAGSIVDLTIGIAVARVKAGVNVMPKKKTA